MVMAMSAHLTLFFSVVFKKRAHKLQDGKSEPASELFQSALCAKVLFYEFLL